MKRFLLLLLTIAVAVTCFGQERRTNAVAVADSLYNQSRQDSDLGLKRLVRMETVTVFTPSDSTDHFCNGVCMVGFKGNLYCMWQSSKDNEDSPDTWVAYARSTDDGKTWSKPMVLADSPDDGIATSGGWLVAGRELIAYINVWSADHKEGRAVYKTSRNGLEWSEAEPVLMDDGSPMMAVIEQDPHVLPSGRILNAAHFSSGLQACPIYTDDKSGKTGWHKADFQPTVKSSGQSRELEPSSFVKRNGTLVMIFRDQNSSFRKLVSISNDGGKSWTPAALTNIPDSRSKQCAGNLPDGTAYFIGNPVENKMRYPLVITLSHDGTVFDRAFLIHTFDELPEIKYNGSAKRKGYSYPMACIIGRWLYVGYSVNKEMAQYVRINIRSLSKLECL